MIAALHLLSDNAINFKQAKNKKLHVELALIKLTYLQQAITITASDDSVVKKKSLDSVKTLAFKTIRPIGIPAAKILEKTIEKKSIALPQQEEATLHIEEPRAELKKKEVVAKTSQPSTVASTPTLASLKKLQKEVASTIEIEIPIVPLTKDGVDAMMEALCKKLRAQGKDSTVSQLCSAEIEVVDETNFVFYTHNSLHSKFIIAERAALADTIQEYFHNPAVKYEIITKENNSTDDEEEKNPVANKREQYASMVKKNPLIQQLKDDLRLTID